MDARNEIDYLHGRRPRQRGKIDNSGGALTTLRKHDRSPNCSRGGARDRRWPETSTAQKHATNYLENPETFEFINFKLKTPT